MAEHEPHGEKGDDEASSILMKTWDLRLLTHTPTHPNTFIYPNRMILLIYRGPYVISFMHKSRFQSSDF